MEERMTILWRSRYLLVAALTLLPAAALGQTAPAENPPATADTTAAAEAVVQLPEQLRIGVGGVFTTWFQNQRNFTFGGSEYNDRYVVQMLRFNLSFGYGEYIKAVTRLDIAQGWWGVDNENWRDDNAANPNASSRFGRKDTNYGPHVDHGYLEFTVPNRPLTARVGRMYYGLGNRIILDSNYDGIQLDWANSAGKLTLGWGKTNEGAVSISDLGPADGRADASDADLLLGSWAGKAGAFNYGLFGLYYNDRNVVPAYPMKLDYMLARFRPAISTLTAVGAMAAYDVKSVGLKLEGEANYLMGTDDYARQNSGPNQLLDLNNGDLAGYNVYAKATKTVGTKADLGFVFGLGSGDDDVTSGKGNINHLKTMGFFYITELWDDSIMPDEEGITPQGLGAPNVRGYRELENTTIGQINLTVRPAPRWRTSVAGSLIRATEPIRGWTASANGVVAPNAFTSETSSDIGREINFLVNYQPYPRLDLTLRGGHFSAGDAALLLVHGRTNLAEKKNPWELKGEVTFRFGPSITPLTTTSAAR
jgi:hypothetical protein